MTIPDYQALMLPLLKRAALGELRVLEAEKVLGDDFGLTPEEREQLLPSGKQRVLHNRAHWAKFYLMKAGLVKFPSRGTFVATDAGRALLAKNPDHVNVDLLRQYPSFEEFYRGSHAAGSDAVAESQPMPGSLAELATTPEEQIEKAFVTVQSALRAELLQRIMQNTPSFFEGLIIDLLVKMGYGGSRPDAAAQLGRSGDGGVDGVINEDRLGLDRVYLQAKRYSDGNVVGRPEVQKFLGSLVGMGAVKGVFVTTSKFSQEAIEFAKHLTQRIILIDGQRFAELMIEHGVGVRRSPVSARTSLGTRYFIGRMAAPRAEAQRRGEIEAVDVCQRRGSARHPLDEREGRREVGIEPEANIFLAGRGCEAIVPRRNVIGKPGKLRPQPMVHLDPSPVDDEIGECPVLRRVDRDTAMLHAEPLP